VCISPKGHYYLKDLKNRFHYLDLILQDTPIFNEEYFSHISKCFPLADPNGKRNLKDRVQTLKEFLIYIQKEESKQSNQIKKKYGSIYKEIYDHGLRRDLGRIKKKI
jgi:hypothetical protein